MSKILVITLYNVAEPSEAVSIIRSVGKEYGIGVHFDIPQDEPFLCEYGCPDLLFTISDGDETDNCERFLLPDGWTINSVENPIPFAHRMKVLQQFADSLNNICARVEILVGESGMDLDDFALYKVMAQDIPNIMAHRYCGISDCRAVRLLVCK